MNNSVILGMSGGIDSSVAALELKKAGRNVTGCHLLLKKDANICSKEVKSAQNAAQALGINLVIADYRELFYNNVEKQFTNEYLNGRTPNPCIICNPTVKFKTLIAEADKKGITYVATGHYAKTAINTKTGLTELKKSPSKKDQSYFLYRLSQQQLSRVIFPLGDFLSKDEIRAEGAKAGFISAKAPDSQDICFIPSNDYISYIREAVSDVPKQGSFVDINGNVIGTHSGLFSYTVGQRKGLGAFGEPRYVKSININNNTVTLCKADERFDSTLTATKLTWIAGEMPDTQFEAEVKIRSTAKAAKAEIQITGSSMTVHFYEPVLAPCPGQSAVIYSNDTVLGGGIITEKQ